MMELLEILHLAAYRLELRSGSMLHTNEIY